MQSTGGISVMMTTKRPRLMMTLHDDGLFVSFLSQEVNKQNWIDQRVSVLV